MKKTSRCTTMKIQNLQTKLCQHKSPIPSKPFHIRKMVKKGCGQHEKSFFLRIKKSSRTTDAMIPKIKNVIEIKKICGRMYRPMYKHSVTQGQFAPCKIYINPNCQPKFFLPKLLKMSTPPPKSKQSCGKCLFIPSART